MRKILLATTTFFMASTAFAADLPRKSYPVMPDAMPAALSWQGFYLGANLGWFKSESKAFDSTGYSESFSKNSVKIGGFLGYNWQFNNIVAGLEGDIGYVLNSKKSITPFAGVTDSVERPLDASLRLRAGYLITPSVLLYATGGLAYTQQTFKQSVPAIGWSYSDSRTRTGYTIGAGVEALLTANWIARLEYRYSDFGNQAYGDNNFGNFKIKSNSQQVNLGLAYKF